MAGMLGSVVSVAYPWCPEVVHLINVTSKDANITFRLNRKYSIRYQTILFEKRQKQEAKNILETASSTVKKDKKLILTKTIIVNIVLSDGKNKKESTTINCKCIGAKMESKQCK